VPTAVVIVLGIVAAFVLLKRWHSANERRNRPLPPLIFAFDEAGRQPLIPRRERAAAPVARASQPSVSAPVEITVASRVAAGAPPLAPQHSAVIDAPTTSIGGPAQLRVVRDDPSEVAMDRGEVVSHETVRFRRPADEPVQLLPGRLEVLAGDPNHREIRFVRVPGRPAELILGREPGDSPQYGTLHSTTVSRRHARFAFDHGQWTVMNLSRTNPTVVNGVELSANDTGHDLRDGDRLELGEVVLRFHVR